MRTNQILMRVPVIGVLRATAEIIVLQAQCIQPDTYAIRVDSRTLM